jgi:hypothetical protein
MTLSKAVNFLIIADFVFELEAYDLYTPDHDFSEIPPKGQDGRGFNNLFEFLLNDQWHIITVSDMNGIIDKIEASICVEWHQVRGLQYSKEQMKKGAEFAFSVTPYLGEQHYDDDDNYRGYEKFPYLVKYLREEQRYDIPILNLDAPSGTCIWQNKSDRIDAEDN